MKAAESHRKLNNLTMLVPTGRKCQLNVLHCEFNKTQRWDDFIKAKIESEVYKRLSYKAFM